LKVAQKGEAMNQQDKSQKKDAQGKVEAENYITGGTFGPGSAFGRKSKVEAETIAGTINQVSAGVNANQLSEFLALLDQIRSQVGNLPEINEYELKDLNRSIETVEDHAKRPNDARDSNILMQALDKVRSVLVKAVPVAALATQLWEMGRQLFGK
jgi:hypothetical protein